MTENPMHAHVDAEGAVVAYVFDLEAIPEGDAIVDLPEDFWTRLYRWDAEAGAFVPDIEGSRAALWEAVKAKRFSVELGGCATPLGRMDSDVVSQQKLIGAVTMAMLAAQAGTPFSVDWTMADNGSVTHDGPAIIAAGMAMGTFVATAHAVAIALRGAIDAAQSFEELDAIDVEAAPWPGTGEGQ